MFSVVISHLFEPPWIDDQGHDVQLPSIEVFSLEFLDEQGRQFLTGEQEHSRREVLTTFELWFKGTEPCKVKCKESEK